MPRFLRSGGMFVLIFTDGFVLMGFEMLGSRYLNPYFGSGITTWACLISVVLFSMMVGYMTGGQIADRAPRKWIMPFVLGFVGLYLIGLAQAANGAMDAIMTTIGYGFWGTILGAIALSFVPVAMLASLSPLFVRMLLAELRYSGRITGAVYGVSTMGNVIGTLVTTFVLIPTIGTTHITLLFGAILLVASALVALTSLRAAQMAATAMLALALGALMLPVADARADNGRQVDAQYPEGPLWLNGRLYVAEMSADRISRLEGDHLVNFWSEKGCGPTSVASYAPGVLAVACHLGGHIAMISTKGQTLSEITAIGGHPLRSPNDIHAQGKGFLFVTDPGLFTNVSKANLGNVYFHSETGDAVVIRDLHYPNGVAFDAETDTLYISEHMRRRVLALTLDDAHGVTAKKVVLETGDLFPDGLPDPLAGPDGLRLAPDGALVVALYGAGRVVERRADGTLHNYLLPFRYTTSIAPRRKTLVVVGAFSNRDYPYAGKVAFLDRWH